MQYKELFREDLHGNKQEIILDLECYFGKFRFSKLIAQGQEYVLLKTATTPMRTDYYTGEVISVENDKARVFVKYGETTVELYDVRLLNNNIEEFDRVILSEHLTVDGNIEWVASTEPLKTGDLNFIVIALKDCDNNFIYKNRIDVVTGETREEFIDGNSIRSS